MGNYSPMGQKEKCRDKSISLLVCLFMVPGKMDRVAEIFFQNQLGQIQKIPPYFYGF